MNQFDNIRLDNYLESKLYSITKFISTLVLNFDDARKIIFAEVFKGTIYAASLLELLRKIIWNCLPIALLTVSASAFIYSVHVAPEMLNRGLSEYLGGLVSLALIREGVPVMASLAIISQYSTGITAQIGSMKITEQLDAMKILKVTPSSYLLVPMLFAGMIGFPVIAIICVFVGLIVNYISSHFLIDISYNLYFSSVFNSINVKDIFLCLIKTSVFGFTAALISYTVGILTRGGSKGVGNSTRLSVVLNFILVIILDYLITALWL